LAKLTNWANSSRRSSFAASLPCLQAVGLKRALGVLAMRAYDVMRCTRLGYRIAFWPSTVPLYVPVEKVPRILNLETGKWVIIDAEWALRHGLEDHSEETA
jgi:hypothetical protein